MFRNSCPIDHQLDFRPISAFHDGGQTFHLICCEHCDLVSINPLPTRAELRQYYSTDYYGQENKKFLSWVQWLRRLSMKRRIRRIEYFTKQRGSLLDVGCADGSFLFHCKKRGWKTVGLELSNRFGSSAYLRGSRFLIGDITQHRFQTEEFDVVTFLHVFEHVNIPAEYLKEIYRILKKDGLIVLTIPNIRSWQARLFGNHWFHLDLPRHLFHYSPQTITLLLHKHGFVVEKIDHFSLEYNPYGYIQSLLNAVLPRSNILYDSLKNSSSNFFRFLSPTVLINILLLPILFPFCLIASIVESRAGHGGTIKVFAKKRPFYAFTFPS